MHLQAVTGVVHVCYETCSWLEQTLLSEVN